jgi:uncharacterized coiled-coil protein SlyX
LLRTLLERFPLMSVRCDASWQYVARSVPEYAAAISMTSCPVIHGVDGIDRSFSTHSKCGLAVVTVTDRGDWRSQLDLLREAADHIVAERRVLAELGVDSMDKARALVAKANVVAVAAAAADDDGDESPKKNRLRELEFSAAAQATKIAELESLVVAVTQERATNTLSSLSEPVRKAIEAATDDAEERIALAQVFVAAGLAHSPTAAQLPVAIVSTAPPRSAPSDANASAPNRRQEYDRLKKENPVAAAHYLKAFGRDIFPG